MSNRAGGDVKYVNAWRGMPVGYVTRTVQCLLSRRYSIRLSGGHERIRSGYDRCETTVPQHQPS